MKVALGKMTKLPWEKWKSCLGKECYCDSFLLLWIVSYVWSYICIIDNPSRRCYYLPMERSPEFTAGHLQFFYNFLRKEINSCAWFHCARIVEMNRLLGSVTYSNHTKPFISLVLRSVFNLALRVHYVYVLKRFEETNPMAFVFQL